MTTTANHRVAFPAWYDERAEWEAKEKGWLQGVEVHFSNGTIHPLFFYDSTRLAQDLTNEADQGRPFIAHHELIVVPEITREAILAVVDDLVDADYFLQPANSDRSMA
jgi:hypothetical protein